MLAIAVAGVVDATARHDGHVTISADVEIVIDQLTESRLGQQHGNVHTLVLGAGLNVDVDAGGIVLLDDLDMLGGVLPLQLTVDTEGVSSLGHFMQVGDLRQKFLLDRI